MPLPEEAWAPALESARVALGVLARQRLPVWLRRRVDPSDVVQITLQEAHQKRGAFLGTSTEQLLAWLRPILVHRMIDEIRRCRAQERDVFREEPLVRSVDQTSSRLEAELRAAATSPSGALMRREEIDRMSRALEKLPQDQQLVVELHFLQGLKMTEIAQVLEGGERDPSTCSRLLFRGLRSLREALEGRD